MKLFDKSGKPVEVPDDQVHEALSSGQYGAPKGTLVPVEMGGQVGTVPIEHLRKALDSDARVVPQSVHDAAELQAEYGDAKHGAIALGAEAANTATLGGSNALVRAIGGTKAARTVRKSQEANPGATGIGTAVGVVAPIAADVLSAGALTPELAAVAAERATATQAERVLAKGAVTQADRALAGEGAAQAERALAQGAERAAPGAERAAPGAQRAAPGAQRAAAQGAERAAPGEVVEGLYEAPIPIHEGEEMLGEVVPGAPRLGQGAPRLGQGGIDGVLESPLAGSGPRLGAEEMLGEVVPGAPRLGQGAPRLGQAPAQPSPWTPRLKASALEADFEEVGVRAARDVYAPPGPLPVPGPAVGPAAVEEAQAAAQAAQAAQAAAEVAAERVKEAAQFITDARAAGPAVEAQAAQAAGKGFIRQTIDMTLVGPTRAVAGIGDAVEAAVRSVVGTEAESALGRIAQNAIIKGSRGAVEGGIYSVGNEAGHQFLQEDPDLSGGRLGSAFFSGMLLGGGFGVATGTLGRGAKEVLDKAVGHGGVAQFLSDKAGEHMWHAAGGTKKMTANAEKYAGGVAKVGNLIREDAELLMGRTPRSREEMLELAGMMQEKHAGGLDAVLQRLDEHAAEAQGQGTGQTLKDIVKRIESAEKELKARAAPHGELTAYKKRVIDALEARDSVTGEVNLSTPVTFKQLREFRRTADEASKFDSANPNAVRDSFRRIRHELESDIETAAAPHFSELGGSLLNDYKAAKAGYQAGKLLEKASSAGVAAAHTNQFTSLTDKIFGGVAAGVVGHASGPVGAFMAHQAAGFASKQVRKNFDFVVSDVLAKLAKVSAGSRALDAAQATSERFQKRLNHGMDSIQKGLDGKAVGAIPPVAGPKTFEERRALLLNLAAQTGHLENAAGPLANEAPAVAQALNATALRALTYLTGALPAPPPAPKDNLTPKLFEKEWKPSDPQKAAFNRRYDMAVTPEQAPALVAHGLYTPDHDHALSAVHGKIKADAGAKLRKTLDHRVTAVPPGMRTSVKLFLGVPLVDKSLGKLMQSNYSTPSGPQTSHTPKTLSQPLKLNTEASRLP